MMYTMEDGKYVIWYDTTIYSSMGKQFKEMAPPRSDGVEKEN